MQEIYRTPLLDSDRGNARRHGFQDGQTKGLVPARERQDGRAGIDLRQALAIRHQPRIDGVLCGLYEALCLGSERPITDDAELVRSPLTENLERLKQNR